MRSLAKAYRKLKRESEGFKLTKDEFVFYVMMLFPRFKVMTLRLPIKRIIYIPKLGTQKDLPSLASQIEYVEIEFPDLMDYLNKKFIKLMEKA